MECEFDYADCYCEVCRQETGLCECVECPVCQEQGRFDCYDTHIKNHGLVLNQAHLGTGLGLMDGMKPSHLAKMIYNKTECGASIHFKSDMVIVGACVEGSDATTEWHELKYPFKRHDFWDAVKDVEMEVDDILAEIEAENYEKEENLYRYAFYNLNHKGE